MSSKAPASEFPNDNPLLSAGAVWVCPEVRGRPRPHLGQTFDSTVNPRLIVLENADLGAIAPPRPAPPLPKAKIVPPAPAPAPVAAVEPVPSVEAAPPPPPPSPSSEQADAFAEFVRAMVDVAQAHNATRAAACLPALLGAAPFRANALGAEFEKQLAERGILAPSGRKRSDHFEQTSNAWRAVLMGQSDDLSSCGTTTLDRFGAELLTAVLELPKSRMDELRRDLRRRGVAAFGMIAQAA